MTSSDHPSGPSASAEPTIKDSLKPTIQTFVQRKIVTPAVEEKVFHPLVDEGHFKPTAGSLFRPIAATASLLAAPTANTDRTVSDKFSQSLLEMVELMTPQLDSTTEHGESDQSPDDEDDAEDEAEREAWEAEERERRRMRRRHTRQWMRTLRTDTAADELEYSDTSV
jgi:hypothetical protein